VKPPPFEYHAATSVDEAVALLAEYGDDAKVLAGGQSLVPLLSLRLARPGHLIDVNPVVALSEYEVESDGALRVGAIVRHRAVERAAPVRAANPLIADAVRFIGHAAIRTRGTFGGSVAHADPAAELPTVVALLDGEIEVLSARGARTIAAEDFFLGFLMTSLEPDELLVAVRLPAWEPGTGWSFREFSRRSGDFGIAAATATVRLDGDRIAAARLAFSGMAPAAHRARGAEEALVGQPASAELFADVCRVAVADLEPPSDVHGTSIYRRHLAAVLGAQALAEACERAREAA
jgi:carbon-monoxide dehydrogenase medium subunit